MLLPVFLALFIGLAVVVGYLMPVEGMYQFDVGPGVYTLFFLLVAFSKFLYIAFRNAFEQPSYKYYLLPIESQLRGDLQAKLEGGLRELGVIIGGLLLFFLAYIFPVEFSV